MKKRFLLKLGLVALLGAGLFVAWLWWTEPRTGICRYTASKIQPGMTKEEVTNLIGFPSRLYEFGPQTMKKLATWTEDSFLEAPSLNTSVAVAIGDHLETWMSQTGVILVVFDNNGRVRYRSYLHPESILDKVRRWLHLD